MSEVPIVSPHKRNLQVNGFSEIGVIINPFKKLVVVTEQRDKDASLTRTALLMQAQKALTNHTAVYRCIIRVNKLI